MASPPASTVARDISAGLLLVSRRDKNVFYMAGSASGGIVGQGAVMQVALRAGAVHRTIWMQPFGSKRLYRDPTRAVTYVEEGMPMTVLNALRSPVTNCNHCRLWGV